MLTTKSLLTSPTQPQHSARGPPPPDAPPEEPSPDATAPPDEPSPDFDVGSDENPPLAEVEAVEADPPSGPAGAFCGCFFSSRRRHTSCLSDWSSDVFSSDLGKSTHDWTREEAQKALRGAPGSEVKLVVERPGVQARLPFTLQRREIRVRSAPHALLLGNGEIGRASCRERVQRAIVSERLEEK